MKAASKILTDAQLHAAAVLRVERALALIENAQSQLGAACAELSALCHGYPLQRATSKLYDKVRAHWWRVHTFRTAGRFYLDPTSVEALEKRFLARVVTTGEASTSTVRS